MGFTYLGDKSWLDITREERLFCSYLYHDLIGREKWFISWLDELEPQLKLPSEDEWEIGYEVCFYRDLLTANHEPVKDSEFPQKRTFDLCLFSKDLMVIIEAKVQQGFSRKQVKEFIDDKDKYIHKLIGPTPKIKLISLVSSWYYPRDEKVKAAFDATITWKQLSEIFNENKDVYQQADDIYGREKCKKEFYKAQGKVK